MPPYTRFVSCYEYFTLGMAAYGFTRGYRARGGNLENRLLVPSAATATATAATATTVALPLLTTQQIAGGMVNGFFYALPGWNIVHLFHLSNRLEIQWRGYPPSHYPEEYHEWCGWCYDTV